MAGREGIEPSLRVLEAQLVTMTLRPRRARFARRLVGESNPSHPMDSGAATPVASRGENAGGPKAAPSRTNGVTYGDRTRLRGFTFHPRPRRVTSPSMAQACAGGLPWSRTTFFRSSGGRYYSTSSQPLSALGGTCTRHRALERRTSLLLDDEGLGALARNRTGSSRLRGGRSTIEPQGHPSSSERNRRHRARPKADVMPLEPCAGVAAANAAAAPAEGIEPSSS